MLMLEALNIETSYADRLIFRFDLLQVHAGDRIGVVGLNGAGKTTLFDILSGEAEPDAGTVRRLCPVAYIRQFSGEAGEPDPQLASVFGLGRFDGHARISGGEQTRSQLADAFSRRAPLVFADEPTSNLDFRGIDLLTRELERAETLLLISHDRALLDRLCTRIIEIRDGTLRFYEGNYSAYLAQSAAERERAFAEYEQYDAERQHLSAAVQDRTRRASKMTRAPKRMGNSEARLHKQSIREKQEKVQQNATALKRRLERLEEKEKPRKIAKVQLSFALTNPPRNKILIEGQNLSFSYDGVPIFEDAAFQLQNGEKVAVLGENGAGKTTLLNLIAGGHDGIRAVPQATIGYVTQSFEQLDPELSILENVMRSSVQDETTARTVLARLLIRRDDVFKPVKILSGGEKVKTGFAKLLCSAANILLLDEPTNYLDLGSIEALEEMVRDYEGTVLFVSHDRAFVNAVSSRLFIVENRQITDVPGNLEPYEARR